MGQIKNIKLHIVTDIKKGCKISLKTQETEDGRSGFPEVLSWKRSIC